MAAKRLFEDSDNDPDRTNHKRLKTPKPSFASVIKEVVTMNLMDNFCAALEPMVRRVVHEEVENGLRRYLRSLTKSPSLRIQAIDDQPSLQLIFHKNLALPIFTGTKITDADGNHLQVLLVETRGSTNDAKVFVPASLPHPVKIEMVVLDGDFPPAGDLDKWTTDEFNRNVVRERTGKRPLLAAGELSVVMRDGACSFGEIEFTDNSSWIRSRRFRLGARVAPGASNAQGQVVRIRPAMTESFVVKDHRGELYKKHYPPALGDEVWRLEKIGKEGAFHRKLSDHRINTVQDFLKLSVVEPLKLKKILGVGMSEKMWDVTLKHARTCEKGTKLYVYRGPNYLIVLNPVCQVLKAIIDGQVYALPDLTPIEKGYIEKLAKEAYANWSNLQEIEGQVNDTALLTMGEYNVGQSQYPPIHQDFLTEGSVAAGPGTSIPNNNNNAQVETYDSADQWDINYFYTPLLESSSSYPESSPDGDLR